jgi:hypothetical protein
MFREHIQGDLLRRADVIFIAGAGPEEIPAVGMGAKILNVALIDGRIGI